MIVLGSALVLAALRDERRRNDRVPRLATPDRLPADAPLVSLLIPARNEARTIARCVQGALEQTYCHSEVVVLDDGSTDATPAILAGLAGHPRLRVLCGGALPSGWTGKCYACRRLADQARGEWLLFLDADTAPGPDLVAALLAHAAERELDLVTVTPYLELESFWERLVLPTFFTMLTAIYPLERMERSDARPGEVFASGWCFLVRRSAYEAIGGHTAVRGEVLEDVRLAQALRAAGYRIGGADGAAHVRLRMYRSGAEIAAGLGKNAAAGYQSGGRRSTLVIARMLAQAFGPFWLCGAAGLVRGRGAAVARGAALLSLGASLWHWAQIYAERYGLRRRYAVLWPFGLLSYLVIAARGMVQVWGGRGVEWKGRRYGGM